MSYSIAAILHPRADATGLHKIQIRVIHKRKKIYHKTDFRVKQSQFDNGAVVGHHSAATINRKIRDEIDKIEGRIINSDFINVTAVVKNAEIETPTLKSYIENVAINKSERLAPGTVKHINSIGNKIDEKVRFEDISLKWLEHFESNLRKPNTKTKAVLDKNTVHANMKRLKSLLKLARKDGFISREQFEDYQVPSYEQKLVEYLTEEEINKFQNLVFTLGEGGIKRAGYYFLLSCYAGYRLSDAKVFDAEKMINDNNIILRTKKNKEVVSMFIHSRLKVIIDYIRNNPLDLSEHHTREFVKKIGTLSGIKKKIKFHTSRHTFAMLLMSNDFSRDEVAELIGDSDLIAKVYARIHNPTLNKKIKEKLG